jgi:hypothetical protein
MTADNDTAVARVAPPPSFAEQVAATDPAEVAARIAAHGARAAIGASTVELVALAQRFMALLTIADLTYEMLANADRLPAEADAEARRAKKLEVSHQISVIGASLEALGYGQSESPEEKPDGNTKD